MDTTENRNAVAAHLARRHLIAKVREYDIPEGNPPLKYNLTRSECPRPGIRQWLNCNCTWKEMSGLSPAFCWAIAVDVAIWGAMVYLL